MDHNNMDNLILFNMLECPLCLEKLDTSAKVLPCQHTFCKPCLQSILRSHKELRCPECRSLVLSSIEDLPSNLFLIRLLDGIQFGPNLMRFGSLQRTAALSSPGSIRRIREEPRTLQLSQYKMTSSPRIPLDGVPRAKALYSYRGHSPGELRFNKGDIIALHRQLDENWYLGEINRVSGVFPTNAVQVIQQLPQSLPLCRALYNFNLTSKNNNEKTDCLPFHKPNTTAQQLLQSSPPKCVAPLQRSLPKAKGTESHTFCKKSESRRKSVKQFSITTALNAFNRMVHSPTGRQTLDISSPVLISSSNPSVATQNAEKIEFPCNIPEQVSPSCYTAPETMGHAAAIVSLPHLQQHLSVNMAVALHSYTAHGPEELEMQKGEGIRVLGKYREGWLKGVSLITGKVGIFPSSYVAPLFRKSSNFSNSKMPSLYATWTLSTSSLSSQGTISENSSQQSRPLKSAFVPTTLTSPMRSLTLPRASGQTASLRRGRSGSRKNGSLQKLLQPGGLIPAANCLQQPPATLVRSQQTPVYQSISTLPRGAGTPDAGIRLNSSHTSSVAPLPRSGSSRAPSVCSAVTSDTSEAPAKNEVAVKPPASAPPSILVKPDTFRNTTEKQVKTVRFQNYSPPPSKRHNSVSSSNPSNGKPEQGVEPEANIKAPEISVLYSHHIMASPVHQKRMPQNKTSLLDLCGQADHLTFSTKKQLQ